MKKLTALLSFAVFAVLPAMAESAPEELVRELQAAYDQNTKAMDDGDLDAFMELFAEGYVAVVSADERLDREQVRELASAEMERARRPRSTYSVQKVDFIDGGRRTELVATVLQTIVNETVDRQGKKVRKSLKVHYRDTFAKHGASWQITLRESL